MKIEYKPGATYVVADALSRAPSQGNSDGISSTEEGSDVLTVEGNNIVQLSESDVMLKQVQLEQQKDPKLARLID